MAWRDAGGVGAIAAVLAAGGVCHQLTDCLDSFKEPALAGELLWREARDPALAAQHGDDHVPTSGVKRRRGRSGCRERDQEGRGRGAEVRDMRAQRCCAGVLA
jgi:hypothetical protein